MLIVTEGGARIIMVLWNVAEIIMYMFICRKEMFLRQHQEICSIHLLPICLLYWYLI